MPYSVVSDHPECSGYAVVKDETNEVIGCHQTSSQAQAQLTALNISEYGERVEGHQDRALPDNYRPATSEDVPEDRNCGNCIFNENLYCTKWDSKIVANYYCNAWQPTETRKQKALDILKNIRSMPYNITQS